MRGINVLIHTRGTGLTYLTFFQPREKPLRTKRSHRRHGGTPRQHGESPSAQSSFMNETTKFQAYRPSSSKNAQYRTQSPHSPIDGHPRGADPTSFAASSPSHSTGYPSTNRHPLISPIPPTNAFTMYLDSRFLDQREKYKGIESEEALLRLAQDSWDAESEGTKQLFYLQETKQRDAYQAQKLAMAEYEADHHYHQPQQREQDREPVVRGGGGGGSSGGATGRDRTSNRQQRRGRSGGGAAAAAAEERERERQLLKERDLERDRDRDRESMDGVVEHDAESADDNHINSNSKNDAGRASSGGGGGFTAVNG